jgi:hypothetical protein
MDKNKKCMPPTLLLSSKRKDVLMKMGVLEKDQAKNAENAIKLGGKKPGNVCRHCVCNIRCVYIWIFSFINRTLLFLFLLSS